MNEYQVKFRIPTGDIFHPYISGADVYEADSAKEAIQMAKDEYEAAAKLEIDTDEYPLKIVEITKL